MVTVEPSTDLCSMTLSCFNLPRYKFDTHLPSGMRISVRLPEQSTVVNPMLHSAVVGGCGSACIPIRRPWTYRPENEKHYVPDTM